MNLSYLQNDGKKTFDITAYLVVFIGVLSIILSILLYSFFYQQHHRQKIETIYHYQGIWLATPKQLLWLDKTQQQVIRLDKQTLGLSTDDGIVDMLLVSTPNTDDDNTQNLWVNLSSSQVFHCQILLKSDKIEVKKTCEMLPETKNLKTYVNILNLPNANKILLVDNSSGLMQTYDATNGQKLLNIDYYKMPSLPTFADLTNQLKYSTSLHSLDEDDLEERVDNKLYQANHGQIFNTDISMVANVADVNQKNLYIQTDTGNYRLLAWQMSSEGLPDFTKPALVWLKTQSQPFNMIMIPKDDDRNVVNWITLEADSGFKDSKIRRYNHLLGREPVGNTVEVPDASRPDFFAQINETLVLVADKSTAKITQIDFKNPVQPVFSEWKPSVIQEDMEKIFQWKQIFDWLASFSLWLLLVPFYCVWLLFRWDYDLVGLFVREQVDDDENE